jgi:hypothetical protein
LNGPEISQFIKKYFCDNTNNESLSPFINDIEKKASLSVVQRWLKQLHHSLLHADDWTSDDIHAWSEIVTDIQQHWREETKQAPFPKLHMLIHSLHFVERYRCLGKVSESQIESYHYQFNKSFNTIHLNKSHDEPERIRRSLADHTLISIQPTLLKVK